MNILAVGGGGFIGSHFVNAMLSAGHAVTVMGRGTRDSVSVATSVRPGFRMVKGMLSDSALLAELLSDCDLVCHFASSTFPGTSNHDPVGDVESNLVGSIKLLQAMRSAHVQRIIYLSSGGTVYGNQSTQPISESALPHPISSYGVVKLAIEHYMLMYQVLYNLRPIILRLSNPYGVGQQHAGVQGLISTLLSNARAGKVTKIWGDGSQVRDYIYIEDVTELLITAAQSELVGIYNVGSGCGHSVQDVVEAVAATIGIEPLIEHVERRLFDVQEIVLDVSKAYRDMSWRPRTDIKAGLAKVWQQTS